MAPSSPSDRERELVHARIFDVSGEACDRRRHAAQALGHGRDLREVLEVADRLRDAGHVAHANDVVAAHSFGMLLDRARDLAALVSTRVHATKHGWPLAEATGDKEIKAAVAAMKVVGAKFLQHAASAKFDEARSRGFARALENDVEDVAAYVARATSEVFSVAENHVMRGPLFRIVESSAAMRQALEEAEDGVDAREPDSTHQTFRLANLHALARDLEGKTS
jgi:hypothetical protein